MELRRKAQRDDRRRRILREDGTTRLEPSPTRSRSETAIAGRTYTDAALAELQPRLTDFLPQRPASVCMAGLLILFFVAIPLGLDTLAQSMLRPFPAHRQLLISGPGTCATWFATICLFATAALSLLVFNIRRHKLDDYRGRYGVWLWSTLLLLVASIDVATGIHNLAAEVLTELTGASLPGDGSLWWLLLLGGASTVTGLRMVIDMRHSIGSCVLLVLASSCYCVAAAMYWQWWSPVPAAIAPFARASLLLLAHATLCYALLLYARYVFLDAQGVLASSGKRPSKKTSSLRARLKFWERLTDRWRTWRARRADSKPRIAHPRPSKRVDDPDLATDATADSPDEHDEELDAEELERLTDPNLSRSERRRMKKQQRRQQRQAA